MIDCYVMYRQTRDFCKLSQMHAALSVRAIAMNIPQHNAEIMTIVDNKIQQAHRLAQQAGNTDYWQLVIERLYSWRTKLMPDPNSKIG